MPATIVIKKTAVIIECHRCKHRWSYTGLNKYIASCPHCGTKVSIRKQLSASDIITQTPIQDHRKFTVWRILAPYLLNVKKLSNEDASGIISKWLDKCDELNRLNFYPKSKIKEGLSGAAKGYYPISFENLRQDNTRLYDFLFKDDHIGKASTSRGWICALTNLPQQTKQKK